MSGEAKTDLVGWREWLSLPELGIPAIKAKIDTGARTSAIHAYVLDTVIEDGREYACFKIHPMQKKLSVSIDCKAEIVDKRVVRDSGGHEEERYFINTLIQLGGRQWYSDFSLTNRDAMMFRMLLGRTALIDAGLQVEPSRSYVAGKYLARTYRK